MTGISALRSTWRMITCHSGKPLARNARTKSSRRCSSIEDLVILMVTAVPSAASTRAGMMS